MNCRGKLICKECKSVWTALVRLQSTLLHLVRGRYFIRRCARKSVCSTITSIHHDWFTYFTMSLTRQESTFSISHGRTALIERLAFLCSPLLKNLIIWPRGLPRRFLGRKTYILFRLVHFSARMDGCRGRRCRTVARRSSNRRQRRKIRG